MCLPNVFCCIYSKYSQTERFSYTRFHTVPQFIIIIEIRDFLACSVAVAVITKLVLIDKWLGSLAYHFMVFIVECRNFRAK